MNAIRSTHASVATIFVLALTVCWVCGCSDDEEEQSPVAHVGLDPMSPEDTWARIQFALNEQEPAHWTAVIGQQFMYVPDSICASRHPGVFDYWGAEKESSFVAALFEAPLLLEAKLLADEFVIPPPSGTVVVWESVEYSVQVAAADGSDPTTYRGVADLTFAMVGIEWNLVRWVDLYGGAASWNPDLVLPTLGELRAQYGGE